MGLSNTPPGALTRGELIARAALAGAAALLSPASAFAGTAGSGMRTIRTVKGDLQIPAAPKRIVCVANYAMENLFDFGLRPVGVPDGLTGESIPQFSGEYRALPKVGTFDQISVEKVAALRPDLILGLDQPFNTPLYPNLSAIAPTVLFALPGTSAWAHVAEQFAHAVGRTPALVRERMAYRATAAGVRKRYADLLSSLRWAVVTCPAGEWVVWYPDSSGGQVLTRAGVRFSKAVTGKTGNYKELSYERLDQIADADAVAVYAESLKDPRLSQLTRQATWKALPAVQADHVYPFAQLFPYSFGSAQALVQEFGHALKAYRK